MKNRSLFLILFTLTYFQTTAQWASQPPFPGVARTGAVGFTIGDVIYAGLGQTNTGGLLNDFYKLQNNVWYPIANFPGGARYGAVGFSIGRFGYVGTGTSLNNIENDLWRYDTINNSWSIMTGVPGYPRTDAVAFSIGGKGYLGTGSYGTIYLNDFYEFDTAGTYGSWTGRDTLPIAVSQAVGFSIGSKGYIGTGLSYGIRRNEFYEYDVTSGWTTKTPVPHARRGASGFSIGSFGYIGTGDTASWGAVTTDFWQWQNSTNVWSPITGIPGGTINGLGLSTCTKGYAGLGVNNTASYTSTIVAYTPTAPVAAFTSNKINLCMGTCINLIDRSTNAPTSWNWYFSNGSTSTLQNPSNICFTLAGNDTITLTTSSNGICISTASHFINVVDSNDNNFCLNSWCDTISGLVMHNPVDTNDFNICTLDACDPATGNVTHVDFTPPPPSVTSFDSCGQSTLIASGTTGSFVWNTLATTGTIHTSIAGTFWAAQIVNGCTGRSDTVTASPIIVVAPMIFVDGAGMITDSMHTQVVYNWYQNDSLISYSDSSILIQDGMYYLTVTDTSNGCTSDTSNRIFITGLQNLNLSHSSFAIVPNPNSGDFSLQFKNISDIHNIEITDALGKIIYSEDILNANNNLDRLFNLSLTRGVYIIRVSNISTLLTRKLIIQ
jgi:PKD repeat protein